MSLLRIGEARDAAELNNFQMKICIGELFLETQSGFLYFLAQAEWSRAPQAHRIIGK